MKAQDYLTPKGVQIFNAIAKYLEENNYKEGVSSFELSMLANSFDMYADAAKKCKEGGTTQVTKTGYSQVRAEYTVMKTEYQNVLKHSGKFGLNPSDAKKMLDKLPNAKSEEIDELAQLIG